MRYWCGKTEDNRPFIRLIGETSDEHAFHKMFRKRLGEQIEVVDHNDGLGTEIRVCGIQPASPDPSDEPLPDDHAELETIAAEEGVELEHGDQAHQIKHKVTAKRKARKRSSE